MGSGGVEEDAHVREREVRVDGKEVVFKDFVVVGCSEDFGAVGAAGEEVLENGACEAGAICVSH